MAVLPRALRPSVIIRRKAMRQGFLGNSTFWKAIGVVVFGKASIKKFFGKSPEVIDVSALGRNRTMKIITAKPMTRRERKKLAGAGMAPPSRAEQKALATLWAESRDRSRRAS